LAEIKTDYEVLFPRQKCDLVKRMKIVE